jgi:hypothetical protein
VCVCDEGVSLQSSHVNEMGVQLRRREQRERRALEMDG